MLNAEKKGDRIYASGQSVTSLAREFGLTTGGVRICQMDGCGNWRVGVRWPDGKLTWPCTAGMFVRPDGHRQLA